MVSLDHMSAPGIPGRLWVDKHTVVHSRRELQRHEKQPVLLVVPTLQPGVGPRR